MEGTMNLKGLVRAGYALTALVAVTLIPHVAQAIPAFAQQTGQPCVTCHIGAYGPQLTHFGRNFKIGGYTQAGGDSSFRLPLAAMLLGSYTNTTKGQGAPVATHYGDNGIFAMDQISVFYGGRFTDWAGALVQGTFNGVTSTFHLDNTDIRLTWPFDVKDTELRLGLDINNGPTVQDPYNSTYAWGFPFVSSPVAPTPAAQPLLARGMAGNSVGASIYAWYDRSLYFEAGLYNSYGPSLLSWTGNAYGPGATQNPAPYVRAAYEWNWNGQSAHIGAAFLHSNFNPTVSAFSTDGSMGHDSYTDYAIDGGYQYVGDGTHVVSVLGIYDFENQNLAGSLNAGKSSQARNNLNQARANISYWYLQTYGATIGWQRTWGKTNPALYVPAPVNGSANGKPNSNAFIFEIDWVPFGKADSWGAPWTNLKIGAQYTLYTQFNGRGSNYDGFGRNAAGNNTLYLFVWLIF
jgi:hypothetical protein